jgi:hypothetical protein
MPQGGSPRRYYFFSSSSFFFGEKEATGEGPGQWVVVLYHKVNAPVAEWGTREVATGPEAFIGSFTRWFAAGEVVNRDTASPEEQRMPATHCLLCLSLRHLIEPFEVATGSTSSS